MSADNADKGDTLVQVTASTSCGDSQPCWSPDGKHIAYVTEPGARKVAWYATPHLAIAPSNGSGANSPRVLTKELDRNVSSPGSCPRTMPTRATRLCR